MSLASRIQRQGGYAKRNPRYKGPVNPQEVAEPSAGTSTGPKGPALAGSQMPLSTSATSPGRPGPAASSGSNPVAPLRRPTFGAANYDEANGPNMSLARRHEIAGQRSRMVAPLAAQTAPAPPVRPGPALAGSQMPVGSYPAQNAPAPPDRPGPVLAGAQAAVGQYPTMTSAAPPRPVWGTPNGMSALQAWRSRFRR